MHILIVTRRALDLAHFADALAQGTGLPLRFTDGWANAQSVSKEQAPAFAVLDQGLREGPPLELARKIVQMAPTVNLAVISPLAPEAFHEASEGLGILASVPVQPKEADGKALAEVFQRFLSILNHSPTGQE
jgi:hypothetical protein